MMDKVTNQTPDSNRELPQPPYEAPVAVNLGELATGTGQLLTCQNGTSAGPCLGGSAAVLCGVGSGGGSA